MYVAVIDAAAAGTFAKRVCFGNVTKRDTLARRRRGDVGNVRRQAFRCLAQVLFVGSDLLSLQLTQRVCRVSKCQAATGAIDYWLMVERQARFAMVRRWLAGGKRGFLVCHRDEHANMV